MKRPAREEARNEVRITLERNNTITNDPCAICGARCDPDGFNFFLQGTSSLVCDKCAKQKAPEIFQIKKEAQEWHERENGADAIRQTLEGVQERIKNFVHWIECEHQTFLHMGFTQGGLPQKEPISTDRIVGNVAGYFNAISLVRHEIYDLFRSELYHSKPADDDCPF